MYKFVPPLRSGVLPGLPSQRLLKVTSCGFLKEHAAVVRPSGVDPAVLQEHCLKSTLRFAAKTSKNSRRRLLWLLQREYPEAFLKLGLTFPKPFPSRKPPRSFAGLSKFSGKQSPKRIWDSHSLLRISSFLLVTEAKIMTLVAQIARCNRDVRCDSNRTSPNR